MWLVRYSNIYTIFKSDIFKSSDSVMVKIVSFAESRIIWKTDNTSCWEFLDWAEVRNQSPIWAVPCHAWEGTWTVSRCDTMWPVSPRLPCQVRLYLQTGVRQSFLPHVAFCHSNRNRSYHRCQTRTRLTITAHREDLLMYRHCTADNLVTQFHV